MCVCVIPRWLQRGPPAGRWGCVHLSGLHTGLWCASSPEKERENCSALALFTLISYTLMLMFMNCCAKIQRKIKWIKRKSQDQDIGGIAFWEFGRKLRYTSQSALWIHRCWLPTTTATTWPQQPPPSVVAMETQTQNQLWPLLPCHIRQRVWLPLAEVIVTQHSDP